MPTVKTKMHHIKLYLPLTVENAVLFVAKFENIKRNLIAYRMIMPPGIKSLVFSRICSADLSPNGRVPEAAPVLLFKT
jgi:hypothetical protein